MKPIVLSMKPIVLSMKPIVLYKYETYTGCPPKKYPL